MFASTRDLNSRQREAATFGDGPLRVIAGPGTGKTTTLTARVEVLFERGLTPERILLLTFTRRSAREIVSRVRALRGGDRARRVSGGTFHSVAHRTLRRHHAALGLPEGFGVLDHGDAADLIDLVRGELGVLSGEKRLPKKGTLAALYSRTVNTGAPLVQVMAKLTPWCADRIDEVGSVFSAFVARKRSLGLLDFDDLLLYWRVAVQDDALGERLGATYDHILVDEFQDVNLPPARRTASGCATTTRGSPSSGDDAQAIYGFRGASARFLLDADSYFEGLTTITLDVNYRSSAAILERGERARRGRPRGFRLGPTRGGARTGLSPTTARPLQPTSATSPSRSPIASSNSTRRVRPCKVRLCSFAPRTTARTSRSNSHADGSRSSSTGVCGTSRPLT